MSGLIGNSPASPSSPNNKIQNPLFQGTPKAVPKSYDEEEMSDRLGSASKRALSGSSEDLSKPTSDASTRSIRSTSQNSLASLSVNPSVTPRGSRANNPALEETRLNAQKILTQLQAKKMVSSKAAATTDVRTEGSKTYTNKITDVRNGEKKEITIHYKGELLNDLADGQGTMSVPEGSYRGQFKNGRIEGLGVFAYNNGEKHAGIFENGALIQGTISYPDGSKAAILPNLSPKPKNFEVDNQKPS